MNSVCPKVCCDVANRVLADFQSALIDRHKPALEKARYVLQNGKRLDRETALRNYAQALLGIHTSLKKRTPRKVLCDALRLLTKRRIISVMEQAAQEIIPAITLTCRELEKRIKKLAPDYPAGSNYKVVLPRLRKYARE